MKRRLVFGWFVLAAIVGSFLLTIANQPAQLNSEDIPAPDLSPRPVPTSTAEFQRFGGFRRLSEPRHVVVLPTPTYHYAVNLNTDLGLYDVLSLTPAQADAIRHLRCVPALPPETPYPSRLDGCDSREAAGISYLNDIVEAGIMSKEEVDTVLTDHVFHTWR